MLPEELEHWSLTTLREKLVKIGAKVVRHGRYVTFQLPMASSARVDFEKDDRLALVRRPARFTFVAGVDGESAGGVRFKSELRHRPGLDLLLDVIRPMTSYAKASWRRLEPNSLPSSKESDAKHPYDCVTLVSNSCSVSR